MRDIKFRAWDKELKKMVYKDFWDRNWYGTPSNDEGGCHCLYELNYIKHNCELMQYTGLKDKNDVEIYEGDIVKAPHDFGPGGFHKRNFTVRFNDDILIGGYQWNYWKMEESEIIGNIHENKELLNG